MADIVERYVDLGDKRWKPQFTAGTEENDKLYVEMTNRSAWLLICWLP